MPPKLTGAAPLFGVNLSARQLIEIGLWLERNGVEFYRFLSEDQKDPGLRDFFLRLTGMEIKHENWLRDLLRGQPAEPLSKLAFDESLSGREYFLRLRGLVEEKVFPLGLNFITELEGFKQPRDALPAAMRAEVQSVRLYQFLSEFRLDPAARQTVQLIITEEEAHQKEIETILRSLE